ncbi:MAG: DNA-3-methyladenine glycosylase family protein [Roseburia sp.]
MDKTKKDIRKGQSRFAGFALFSGNPFERIEGSFMESAYFVYGEVETEYLKSKDKRLAEVIERIGHIEREVDTDLFSAVIHHIIGQQISTKAQQSIWQKVKETLGEINADTILSMERDRLQQLGMSFRKADYIIDFADKVANGTFDLEGIRSMSDADAIRSLSSLRGVGVWTAEMLLLFCLQRPNIFSFGDFGILRGIRMLYHHKEVDKERFARYRKRFSPYCSVASLYLWAVAGGAIPELRDYGISGSSLKNSSVD